MILIISLILALIPLLGIVWIVVYGAPMTVDGLFTSLILLAMSGILSLNAVYELRKRISHPARKQATLTSAGLLQQGKVESVLFFESTVGRPNQSIVTLSDGANSSHLLALEGDMRNALPVGRKVEITLRKASGYNVLVNVNYP